MRRDVDAERKKKKKLKNRAAELERRANNIPMKLVAGTEIPRGKKNRNLHAGIVLRLSSIRRVLALNPPSPSPTFG